MVWNVLRPGWVLLGHGKLSTVEGRRRSGRERHLGAVSADVNGRLSICLATTVETASAVMLCRWKRPGLVTKTISIQFWGGAWAAHWSNNNKCFFHKPTIKACISCSQQCPVTSVLSVAHLTVSLIFCSSRRNARGESRDLEGRHVTWKIPSRIRKGDKGATGRKLRVFPYAKSLICLQGKSIILYKNYTELNGVSGHTCVFSGILTCPGTSGQRICFSIWVRWMIASEGKIMVYVQSFISVISNSIS